MAEMDVKKLLAETAPLIDDEIAKYIPRKSPIKNLYDGMWHGIGTGGKRLRPVLCLVAAEALGAKREQALPFAAALEIFHNMTLVHDDIEDGDKVRRDQPAVWVKHGLEHGVNIGDGMLVKAYEAVMGSYKAGLSPEKTMELFEILNSTMMRIVEGQAMEMNFRGRADVTVDEYMDMVWRKTGILIGAAVAGGAVIAGASDNARDKLTEWGKNIGPAFQIRDDILDFTAGKGRGDIIGSDIREGKRSMIAIYTLEKLPADDKKKLLEILDKPREKTTGEDVEWVIGKFNECSALDFAQKRAQDMADRAVKIVKSLDIEGRGTLLAITNFIVNRMF